MDKICNGCYYNKGTWCNCLVVPGGMGCRDRVASDYLRNNKCEYRREGKTSIDNNKPNFENS